MRAAIAALLFIAPLTLPAQGRVIPRPCPQPVPRCVPVVASQVERLSSRVRVRLADRVLSYEIDEEFINRGGMIGEADYLFPLPGGAAFQDLALEINGEMTTGETMDAVEARRIYEEIVRQQKDPALVEWMGQGLLRTRIFPIAPGERKRVQVRYQMVAQREGDALRIDHFRGAGSPGRAGRRPDESMRFTLLYPRTPDYGRAYSPTHVLSVVEQGREMQAEVRGNAREVTILLPVRRGNTAAITVLSHARSGDDGFALITLAPPALPPRTTPRDVTFVLDISGSMRGRKMEQARAAGKQLLATLAPEDRFRLIDFASSVGTFRNTFVQATAANVRAAEEYLDDLQASGSTNISDALEAALDDSRRGAEGRLSMVLFVTDGEPTVGERDPAAIAARAARIRGRARVFTFGLGADVNVTLVEQLALGGQGTATFVRPEESPERAVEVVASRLTNPVATGVRIRAEGVRLHGVHPSGDLDLFAGQDLVVLARYTGSGTARLRFEGMTAEGPVSWSAQATFADRSRANAFVPRLWATQRVGWLAAEKRANGGSAEVDAEIRELGERYGIPTEFTSYFVPEPGVLADLQRGVAGGTVAGRVAAPPAVATEAAVRSRRFEAARTSAEQRQAVSLSDVAAVSNQAAGQDAAGVRQAANRTFVLIDGVWTDQVDAGGAVVVRVKPYSAAYFALIERLPMVEEAFSLGDRVWITGRRVVLELSPDGVDRLSETELRRMLASW
jgi:Ca-activated chloride channel family protein